MDTSEYLPMFLAECREHLQNLNLAIVRIEETPDDTETIDEIFRIAHSFKGMSATMGFNQVAALTHEMENVLELLRQRRGGLERDAIDVLLECLDALEASVESIDTEGTESLEPAALIEKLKNLVRERDAEAAAAEEAGPSSAEALAGIGDRRVLRASVRLASDTLMPAVRAYMLLAAAGDHGEVVASQPAESGVDGFDGRTVEIWIASDHEDAAVAETLSKVSDVAEVAVREHTPEDSVAEATGPAAASPRPGPDAEPEHAAAAHRQQRGSSTVRVDAARLDQLMHLMGELVVNRTRVESLTAALEVPELKHAVQDLTRSSQALQAMVMQVRMIPVEAVFLRFPRLVRDLSSKLGKKVELILSGQETELDRTVVDALGDPIVHLVRNALDHGIETPDERVAAGKDPTATLEISARHVGGNVVISVREDGRGIVPEKVAKKAAAVGLIPEEAVPSVDLQRAIELLFTPGFSTAEAATDVSGRGVGMDAVRSSIRELGGEAVLMSEPGKGTVAEIRLPLTLAIMAALLVEAQGIPFAVPLDRVERTLRLADHVVRSVAGTRMLVLRDGVLPLLDLAGALGYGASPASGHAVIVRGADQRLALCVDFLVGQRELVTRPLPDEIGDRAALSGGAVLSNGQIALIVDCDALAEARRGLEAIATVA
jgi:two-component system chemotaxis sensor kinase CheA